MTRPPLVLLPSPLLGPAVWAPVAQALRSGGWSVTLPEPLTAAPHGPEDVLRSWSNLLDDGVALVVHSNAGLFVPALRLGHDVRGAVFVDAGLPGSEGGSMPLAPPVFLDFLRGLADDEGRLPLWTEWWPETDALFPDEATRRAVTAEQQRLPLAYFAAQVEVPVGWDVGLRAGYLAFGDTYAEERAAAERRGWPVRLMDGRHLHMLVDPAGVAEEIVGLLSSE